jgi:hypothetical protein
VSGDLPYLIGSRSGLFLVGRERWVQAAEGQFFGLTLMGGDVYAFQAEPGRWSPEKRGGRIVRYRLEGERLIEAETLVSGLDNECHQVDFFDGAFFVVDTYNQAVLEFDQAWRLAGTHRPIPYAAHKDWKGGYAHMNSILGRGGDIHLMLHNGGDGPSELLTVDRGFNVRRRVALDGVWCHDVVELEDGRILCCDSRNGRLHWLGGGHVEIDALMTRGLAVGPDEIAVGSSLFDTTPHRLLTPGFVTFLDRDFRCVARLHLPAAPTQIRRLDGLDLSLSQPRPWPARSVVAAGDPAQEVAG